MHCRAVVTGTGEVVTVVGPQIGAPAGPTRVISIAAYNAAFEQYDYSLASAIAMIMAAVQLVVVLVILGLRSMFYTGSASGGKG